jgi:HPr kinase/phosphorylase
MYRIGDLVKRHGSALKLKAVSGLGGLKRPLASPAVQRPGIALSGYLKGYQSKRILIFGNVEFSYLKDLDPKTRLERIEPILTPQTPAVIIARGNEPHKELSAHCEKMEIPLFSTPLKTMDLIAKMTILLNEEFSPTMVCHGTLVEAFGIGILIQGDSSVGKSEAALGLVERGHRLVADDVVRVKVREETYLEGSGPELTQHLMEIRGIGIINVAHLYGAVCVRESKRLDLVVKLEEWDDTHFYDRLGLEEKSCDILGIKVPFHVLPVKPGRDVTLLIETLVLNHRLKEMGYNSAKEFRLKLKEAISGQKSRT